MIKIWILVGPSPPRLNAFPVIVQPRIKSLFPIMFIELPGST